MMGDYPNEFERDIYDDGEYMVNVAPHKRTNVLLVNKPLGKVTPTTRQLPGPGHTYGFIDLHDEETAGDVLGSWQAHRRAPQGVPGKDFVRLNKYASMSGAVTAKNVATFRRCNDIRLGESGMGPVDGPYFPDSNTVFGKPSLDSAPISDLLTNAYQRRYVAEQRVNRTMRAGARASKKPTYALSQHTKASLGHTKVPAPAPKAMFKLRQFQDVPSRVSHHNYAYSQTDRGRGQPSPQYGRRSTPEGTQRPMAQA